MKCQFPYMVQNPSPTGSVLIPVPCGKCYDCKMRYAQQWCFRIMHEERISKLSYFITLTYNTNFVPLTRKGFMTLDDGEHLRNFVKRVRNYYRYRKKNPITKRMKYYYDKVPRIKYYAVGEYGSQNKRPHYHMVIFNACEESILKAWSYGDIHFGQVNGASVMYSLKYIMKDGQIPMFNGDDRIKEYRRTSINMGSSFLTPEIISYYRKREMQPFIVLSGGFKIAIPRYFREKIWRKEELKVLNLKLKYKFEKIAEKEEAEYYKNLSDKNLVQYEDYKQRKSDSKRQKESKFQTDKRRI